MKISRSPKDQCNIDPSRHADEGSSSCPLIVARASIFALFKDWKPKEAREFEQLMRLSVKQWDTTSGAVNGKAPADVVERTATKYNVKIFIPVRGTFVSRKILETMAREYERPFSILITGIPKSVTYGRDKTWTGDTFVMNVLDGCIWTFDSHRHPRASSSLRGSVLSTLHGSQPADILTMIKWIFETNLFDLNCHDNFVEATIVVPIERGGARSSAAIPAAPSPATSAKPVTPAAPSQITLARPVTPAAPAQATAPASNDTAPVSASNAAHHSKASKANRVPCLQTVPPLAVVTEAVSQSIGETDEAHRERHLKFVATCAHCQWLKHHHEWQRQTARLDPSSQCKVSPIQRAPVDAGPFRIGCVDCAEFMKHLAANPAEAKDTYCHFAPRKGAYAWFKVTDVSEFTTKKVMRHSEGMYHTEASAWRCKGDSPSAPSQTQTSESPVLQGVKGVPSVESFLWALSIPRTNASNRSFKATMAKHDVQWAADMTCDRDHKAVKRMQWSGGGVLHDAHVQEVGICSRLFFAFDDMDQINTLRVRISSVTPTVHSQEFYADSVLDFGTSVQCQRDAVKESLEQITINTTAPSQDPRPAVDPARWAHITSVTRGAAMDGLLPAMQGIALLQGEITNLRHAYKDKPHTTRTVIQSVLRNMCNGSKLEALLISGEKSFVKRVKYCKSFRKIWIRRQHGDFDSFLGVLEHLSYSPNRMDSVLDPRAILCDKMHCLIDVLLEVKLKWEAQAAEGEDLAWLVALLRAMSGPGGLNDLVVFAVDTDFIKINHLLLRVQDKSDHGNCPDVSLSGDECAQALKQSKALFGDLGVFDATATWTYTQTLLCSLRKVREFRVSTDIAVSKIGWPPEAAPSHARKGADVLANAKQHARDLYPMVEEFFNLNYPGFENRAKWGAFDALSDRLPLQTRLRFIRELCLLEGLDGDGAAEAFTKFFQRARELAAELCSSRDAWTEIAESMRSKKSKHSPWSGGSQPDIWRNGCAPLCELILTYIACLDVTTDVERLNAVIRRRESNGRQRHFDRYTLRNELLLATEVPADPLALVTKVPCAMRPHDPTYAAPSLIVNRLLPKRLIAKAQEYYKRFFTARCSKARGDELVSRHRSKGFNPMARARNAKGKASKTPSCRLQSGSKPELLSKAARSQKWLASVQAVCQSEGAPRLLCDGTLHDPSASSSKAATVQSNYRGLVTEFVAAKAREHTTSYSLKLSTGELALPNGPLRVPKKTLLKQAQRQALGIVPRKRKLGQRRNGSQPEQARDGKDTSPHPRDTASPSTPPKKKQRVEPGSSSKLSGARAVAFAPSVIGERQALFEASHLASTSRLVSIYNEAHLIIVGGDWYKAVNHSFLGLVARLFGCTLAHESYWRGDDSGKALVEHFLPLRESISMQCSEAARKERPDLWSVIELAKDKKKGSGPRCGQTWQA